MILDQLIRGIGDKEILADLLGDTRTDRTLAEVVEFIARKEQAKLEQGTVSFESTGAVRQTPATPSSGNTSGTCWACQQPSHGPNTFKTRQESVQLGKSLVTSAATKDTSPKPVPSVCTAVPGDTRARGVESAPNPKKKMMNLER